MTFTSLIGNDTGLLGAVWKKSHTANSLLLIEKKELFPYLEQQICHRESES